MEIKQPQKINKTVKKVIPGRLWDEAMKAEAGQLKLFNESEEKEEKELFYIRCPNCLEIFSICFLCKKVFKEGDKVYCDNKQSHIKHYCEQCGDNK